MDCHYLMNMVRHLRPFCSYLIAFALSILVCFSDYSVLKANAAIEIPSQSSNLQNTQTIAQIPPTKNSDSFVAAAVARTGGAVVRIDTETVVNRRYDPLLDDPFFRDFFGGRIPQAPQQQRVSGQGSGFIVDKSGIILTNAHVVDNTDKVTVTLKDGRTFNGKVQGTDEVTDLAVVIIQPSDASLPVAPLGNSDSVSVGDWAIAVGNPVGLDNTVTLGIISTIGRSAAQAGIPDKRLDFIQTDAAINPGNSGGPLLNSKGEVIGINTAIRADAMGIGFAIPINKAKNLQNILVRGQKVPHPYIGVQMVNLTPEEARNNNQNPNSNFTLPEVNGILVVGVLVNTPAEKAGIRRGDVIISINGKPISDGSELQGIVESIGIDQPLKLKLLRGSQTLDLTLRTAQLQNSSTQ